MKKRDEQLIKEFDDVAFDLKGAVVSVFDEGDFTVYSTERICKFATVLGS